MALTGPLILGSMIFFLFPIQLKHADNGVGEIADAGEVFRSGWWERSRPFAEIASISFFVVTGVSICVMHKIIHL